MSNYANILDEKELTEYNVNNYNQPFFFVTADKIWVDDVIERENDRTSATDFALMQGLFQSRTFSDRLNQFTVNVWNRAPGSDNYGTVVNEEGTLTERRLDHFRMGLRPCFNIKLPTDKTHPHEKENIEKVLSTIKEVKDKTDTYLYHTLEVGKYPKSVTPKDINNHLEKLFNGGQLHEELIATGLVFTTNGQTDFNQPCSSRLNPVFEYNGKQYARVISRAHHHTNEFNNYSRMPANGTPRWVEIEPITCKIKNWHELPKEINPQGKGSAKNIEVITEQAIVGGVPFYPNNSDDYRQLWQNSTLRGFLNGVNVGMNIAFNAKNGGDFTHSGGIINEAFNLDRQPVLDYVVPKTETEIHEHAFAGCVHLNSVTMHKGVEKVEENAFSDCSFKYAIFNKKDDSISFSNTLPENQTCEIIETEILKKAFNDFDFGMLTDKKNINNYLALAKQLNKSKFSLPSVFVRELANNNKLSEFVEKSYFRIFKSELTDLNNRLEIYPDEEKIAFYKFANSLGCFDSSKMLDEKGRESKTLVCQKATSFMKTALKHKNLPLGSYEMFFKTLPIDTKPNQDFLNFVSHKKGKIFDHLTYLLHLEFEFPGVFAKVMHDFERVKQYRDAADENGKPVTLSWADALKKFNLKHKYFGVTDENADMAELFAIKGLSQKVFDEANEIFQRARANEIKNHIISKYLKEESILEVINREKEKLDQFKENMENKKSVLEQIKEANSKTNEDIAESKELIEKLYRQQFSYEFLDKSDPINAILGLYTDCCATLSSNYYGKTIATASIEQPDVQNIVVRNNKGEIIAKGTLYVNQQQGYGVINGFEMKEYYQADNKRTDRILITNAFQRAVKDFAEEYDKENEIPLNKVTLGMRSNKLLEQCESFKTATENYEVPVEYRFADAVCFQKVFYDRDRLNKEEMEK